MISKQWLNSQSKNLRLDSSQFGGSIWKKNNSGQWTSLFEHNDQRSFIPASVSKVFSAAAFFEGFDPNEQIKTSIFTSEKPKTSVLPGSIYIKGAGDPTIVSERLWILANEIKRWGIKTIQGSIVLDSSFFDANMYPASRNKNSHRAYDAPVSSLALNWNALRVRLIDPPTGKVFLDPPLDYFTFKKSSKKMKKPDAWVRPVGGKEEITVLLNSSSYKRSNEEKSIYRKIHNPDLYFGNALLEFLRKEGIVVKGRVKISTFSESSMFELAFIESEPVSSIIQKMMKYSSNFITDSLTKKLDVKSGSAASYAGGMSKLNQELSKVHTFKNQFVLSNASGLGRENRVSPWDTNQFLKELMQKSYYPELLVSFPISCVDGTLKERLCAVRGKVRAKTGLLSGVSALAGYAQNKEGETIVFSFFYNGRNGQQFGSKTLFDRILNRIL